MSPSVRRLSAGALVLGLAVAGACSGSGDRREGFCELVVDPVGLPNDGDIGANLQFALEYEQSLLDTAPDAVEDELRVLVRYVENLLEAYEAAGEDVDLATLEASVDSTGVDAASTVISAYAQGNCPLDD